MRLVFSGGLNENQYPSIYEAAQGSFNFTLSKDSTALIPRGPIDKKGTASNAGDVRGLMQLVTRADSITTLVQAGAAVYSWNGGSTFTSVGSCHASSQLRDTTWALGDYLVITDLQKLTVVKKWDGTTFSTLTTGLGTSLYAKYGLVWRGRVWLFNVTTTTSTPHLFAASVFENPESYDTTLRATSSTFTTGNEAFYMLCPDLRPINGACVFYDQLVVSTEGGKLFVVTGTNSTNYAIKEFYPRSNAIGPESIVNGGDDIYYMKQGGGVESLRSSQNFGDVETDDLSRTIRTTVAGTSTCYAVYDQQNQKVLFFTGSKVLVLHKHLLREGGLIDDNGQKVKVSPWSVYKTQHDCQFSTSAVKYMRIPGDTNYTVYFGDNAGNVYDLNGSGVSSGDNYVALDGTAGCYVSTPDSAALDITGDIDIIAKVNFSDLSIVQTIVNKATSTSSQVSYRLAMSSQTVTFSWSTSGALFNKGVGMLPAVNYVAGADYWIRFTLDVDNGASGYTATLYSSVDGGTTWTTDRTGTVAGITSINAGTAILEIGSDTVGTLRNFNGRIYEVRISNSIGGSPVAKFDASDASVGASSFVGVLTGETYTINGTAAITSPAVSVSGDGGTNAIQLQRKTRVVDSSDGLKAMRHVTRGEVEYRRTNEVDVNIKADWSDEYASSQASVTLNGGSSTTVGSYFGAALYFGGSNYFNAGFTFSNLISHKNFSVVGKGPSCIVTVTSEDDLPYQIDSITLK